MSSDVSADPLRQAADVMAGALQASVNAADGHYTHWDAKGTAGANCPACQARAAANRLARAALAAYRALAEGG